MTLAQIVLSTLFLTGMAHAGTVLPGGKLGFRFSQMNVPVDGQFARFATQLEFNPAQLAQSSVVVKVDLSSVDAGGTEASQELQKPAWFDSQQWAHATFNAKGFKSVGGNRYLAQGQLQLKNKTLPLPLQFTATPQAGGVWKIHGSGRLQRLNFAIGTGEWADEGVVANEVDLTFQLTYKP